MESTGINSKGEFETMSQIKSFMEEQARSLERQIKHERRQLNLYPAGTLAVRPRKSGSYLYHLFKNRSGQRKEKVLNETTRKRAERVQIRHLLEAHITQMESALPIIYYFLDHYQCCDMDSVRASLKPVYREPLLYNGFTNDSNALTSSNTRGYENQFHTETLIHKNSIGEAFRSKGEVQVSELLLNRKVEYVYEPKLSLPDGIVYPDFEIKLPGSTQSKYIEYCGMLENDSYLERTIKKIRSYLHGGKKIGRDVLFFFEDGDNGMDLQIMRRDLESFLDIAL